MTYQYHRIDGNHRTIITLHGTGGDEHDLDRVAKHVDDKATIIGLRGDVDENGLLRWFKRDAPGVFDEDDIRNRAKRLSAWLTKLAEKEELELQNAFFIGFSNGANMINALLQLHAGTVRNAGILHGQIPLENKEFPETDAKLFLSSGTRDRLITYNESKALQEALEDAGADVKFFSHDRGHQVTKEELIELRKFWTSIRKN